MGITKHSSGPWTAFYKHKYDEWHVSIPVAGTGMKLTIAPDGIQSHNREADARLIAAAPDLLAACEAYSSWADTATEGTPDLWPIRDQIRAAITKSKGKL